MITTGILAFREFLEAFLIIGIFFGVSKKFALKKEKEIGIAALLGIFISLALPILVFVLGEHAKFVLTERNADILEGYLLVFSGIFIAYVIFSLHRFMHAKRHETINKVKEKMMQQEVFDISLFLTIVFFVVREGFEIALLTATTSLFAQFFENIIGLLLGFIAAGLIGTAAFFSYLTIPIKKVFQYTEYTIILFGAAMVKNGINLLLQDYFRFNLGRILPISLPFLPTDQTIFGHIMKNIIGLEQGFSLAMLGIMTVYITTIYFLFLHKK